VGSPAMIFQVGVLAQISDWSQGANGLLHIKVVGTRKFRVLQTSVADDQLMHAEVEYLADEPDADIAEYHNGLLNYCKSSKPTRKWRRCRCPRPPRPANWVGF